MLDNAEDNANQRWQAYGEIHTATHTPDHSPLCILYRIISTKIGGIKVSIRLVQKKKRIVRLKTRTNSFVHATHTRNLPILAYFFILLFSKSFVYNP